MRDPSLDNARGVLILLVAAGHALEPLLPGSPLARGLYDALYAFHIPAFALLSGALSKSGVSLGALARTLLAPLVIFQVLYAGFDLAVLGHPLDSRWLWTPYWILWFLLSLFCWRLLLPLFLKVRFPLAAAVLLAVAAGFLPFDGKVLSLARTCVFFPLLLLGHQLGSARLSGLGRRSFLGAAVLAIGCAAILVEGPPLDVRWLYGNASFHDLGVTAGFGVCARLLHLAVAAVLSLAFFAVVPRGESLLTTYGRSSLAPFLLHGFFIRALEKVGVFAAVANPFAAMLIGATVAAVLGYGPIVRWTRPLWSPFPAHR